jgi:predicted enzyme related to lactoylglutathione lyase
MMAALSRLILYARNVDKLVEFYESHFNYTARREEGDKIVELVAGDGGANLMIHPASKGMKAGQNCVKLVFDVEDVEQAVKRFAASGLAFGVVHQANGYQFANAKDPAKNSIQISSRAFRES